MSVAICGDKRKSPDVASLIRATLHLNSRTVSGTLRGPANAARMNKFGRIMRACGSGAALEAFPHSAGIECRDWDISRGRRACVLRKCSSKGGQHRE
jgi:hypothetical protein